MFKTAQDPSYEWPVTVYVPKNGGKFFKATFTAEFRALEQDEIDRVLADIRDGDPDMNFAGECLCGWKDVQDDDGSALVYSDDSKAKLLNIPYARNAVVIAFFESLSGGAARRKN